MRLYIFCSKKVMYVTFILPSVIFCDPKNVDLIGWHCTKPIMANCDVSHDVMIYEMCIFQFLVFWNNNWLLDFLNSLWRTQPLCIKWIDELVKNKLKSRLFVIPARYWFFSCQVSVTLYCQWCNDVAFIYLIYREQLGRILFFLRKRTSPDHFEDRL